ncbi:MFS transporter [Chroococcidiopsis sp. TS-821]|nr:arabinose efflux permease [Chroococcidiopsis sp. TS-821]
MMQPPNLDTKSFLSSPRLHSTYQRKGTSFYHHYPETSYVYQVSHENTTNSDVISTKVTQGAPNGSLLKHSDDEEVTATTTTTPADSEATEVGFLPVLKNHNFLALWSGQVFSQLADKVYLVLMIAIISTRFQTSNQSISGWVSAIMMAFTIPAVLFGSVAGVFVDRWSTKAVLIVTNLVRGGLVLSIPVLLWMTQDWDAIGSLPTGFAILLVLSFLVSTLTQFFAPAEQATIPLIVERRHLLSANSLYTTTMMALVVVGFAVGEPLLAIADTLTMRFGGSEIGKELVVGGSYAIAGCLLMLLKTGEKNCEPERTPHIWQDLRDGFEYLGKNHRIRTALIQLVILFSIFAALAVLAVRMAEVIPQIKSSQFGFLLAAGGVGIAAGATLLGQYGQRISAIQLSLYGSVGIAGCLVGLAIFTEQLLAVLLLITLLGGFASLVAIPMQTAIQKETSPEMRGKIFGLQNNVINIALTLPLALAGVAETFIGLQAVFLSLAAAAIAGGLLTWYICRTET